MDFLSNHLLSVILFFPVFVALVIWFLPKEEETLIRWTAFIGSLVPFALTLVVWFSFDQSMSSVFQFEENYIWYETINSNFHIGVDGISLSMVLLTTLLTPLAILASFSVKDKIKPYMMLFLFLEMGMLGVFLAMDLLIFFVFWEIGLVPMYFLINQWGSKNRNYASLKFMIYTVGGSLGLLLAIQLLGVLFGTYDIAAVTEGWTALSGTTMGMDVDTVKNITFWAFVVAFAIKVPVWPFHTWLPDAHTEAPTAGSMILAGVLLKLGAYGFIRLVLPLYPEQSAHFAGWLAFLAVMAIVFGAFGAYGQWDFKRLVAYSSVNHMGFVLLGIAAAAKAYGTANAHIAMNGAILQMFNHGLSAAGMFFLVGVIYERTHTRDLRKFGGLFPLVPIYGGILIFTSMASLGLPGLNGFVSEFLVVRGAWGELAGYTAAGMLGLLFTGAYILKGVKNVLHGPMNEEWAHGEHKLTEINTREIVVMVPLMVLMLVLGIAPAWLLSVINNAVTALF
ncbi:MAG: NADH-quinone oxidoreductase subunit M [Anaerolineae bacterium]|jgi:NADH-quinone oxidoreductase subunit M|nr:NADH-quinone oxidoreductase subunit M [Anaerolineae bacterium]MBT4311118.1 NADH-quinone oxidoreductase subunit M [Anaerolineae bacterium]MBT4459379.1 NADH-quinone oxidoreductase subunit M [Anaerolineae bacterium]MBT4841281.1 NADH-quinone oxidoreductase subunit M [Anaerolineae bacterium]MBT6322946.1 NADH-quinone oxidoreductase subunit M [Anaerolineae bacterium]